ncbi:MAG: Ig-like domain repeat protein [Pyrinomonadaceae bacterium]|nr:Ig-like domain repeat protein [Pyrinomonadaceae bacterium]
MPRTLRHPIYVTPLLSLVLLLLLMSLPGGRSSLWNHVRPTVGAATFFSVNSTGDGPDSNLTDGLCNDGTGACTLRAAMQEANTIAGDDTITFDITLNGSIITLNSSLPDIAGNLNFSGNGSSLLTVQRSTAVGTPDFRIFTINPGIAVTITGLTISNGHVAGMTFPANSGGGILNSGTLTVNLCTVSGNSASAGGGAGIHNLDTLIVSDSVISGNSGGGIANSLFGGTTTATINHSLVSGNTISSGIYNNGLNGTANLTINNSTISGNTTDSVAGGGGILNGAGSFTSRAALTINNSTISGNHATAGQGGGIYSAAVFGNALTTLTVTNTTITGNTCNGDGGGILHFSNGSGSTALATVTNSTIAGNNAGSTSGKGGGISTSITPDSITTFSLRNTIVAKNIASASANAPDLSGDFDSQDYNFIQNTFGYTFTGTTTHNQLGREPQLAALGEYGGLTKTMILLPNSPAIDAGDVSNLAADTTDVDGDGNITEPLPIDQRGFPRVINTRFDIGAVETNYSITATAGSGQSATINTAFAMPFKVTVTESGNLRSGLLVMFRNPPTGASGEFTTSPLVTTDINGVEAAGFKANGTAGGPYNVTAGFSFSVLPNVAFSLTNLKAGTSTAVTSSLNPSAFGDSVMFTVAVTPTTTVPLGGNLPTGTLQFKVDGMGLGGPVPLDPTGVMTFNTPSLAVGSHVISADYSGDANFTASTGTLPSPQVVNVELAINDVTITEGDSGTRTADFMVTLTAGSNVQVKVDLAMANGTAAAGSDYQLTSGTLIFNPGQTTQPISVTVNGDISFESNETFLVNLSNPVNAIIRDPQGVGTISNDDAQGGFISLSQTNYMVGESAGFTTITVNRSNDLSGPATVDYATSDDSGPGPCSNANSVASPRCDFTAAFGTLRFAAGESSQTFVVLISQDNYLEGPEALALTLSNLTGGAAFAAPSFAILTITDDPTEPSTNPIDTANAFVRQHYHDFLNREPDLAGLEFWTNQITECQQPGATCNAEVRRINVSAAFFLSIEFQETGYFVYRTYKASYGNITGTQVPLRLAEFLPDTQQIGKGVIFGEPGSVQRLENNKVAFALDFVSRSRFTSAYPTTLAPAEFVDALFANAGATPSATDRQVAIDEFGGVGNTADLAARGRALRRVAENSTLAQQEFNKAFVLMQYFGYLRRNPNDAPEPGLNFDGYDFWLAKLNQFGGNFINAEMVKAFIISGEYRQRFGP